jgi:hypothetical protein
VRVSAILVINDRSSSTGLIGDCAPQERREPSRGSITCAEILGQSVLDRTAGRLRNAGIRTITVIGGPSVPSLSGNRDVEIIVTGRSFERWPAAQQTVREHGAQGIETVLMMGLGAYAEVNVADALEFHRTQGTPLTQLEDSQGPLDSWIVDSHWFRTAATGCSLPFRYGEFPGLPRSCRMSGYVNRLTEARDLRRLVLDAFLSRCEIRPRGREVRPGIWMDDGARVHKFTRLVAPVYLGQSTKVGSSAVITRFSNLEHHCQVGEGTVVDGTTVLSHSVLGNGLDVSHAVVDGNKFIHLDRNVALQIDDPNLIHDVTPRHSRIQPHREYTSQLNRGRDVYEFEYSEFLSREAGRVSEVLFKG